MGLHCGKHEYAKTKKSKKLEPPHDSLYAQRKIRIFNKSHSTTLVDCHTDRFTAPIEEINAAVAGSGFSEDNEYEMYRYISTPNRLVSFEPGQERLVSMETENAFLTLLQKKERLHKMLRTGQEEDFMISLCENHPIRIGCNVYIHDGWFEIFPESYVWEDRMGAIVEICNVTQSAIYVKIDVDEPTSVDIPISEREGPWFCTNWYHKIYYRKYVPPGFTYVHGDNMKWYLPNAKKSKRKLMITVIKSNDDGFSTSRISRKEIILFTREMKKKGGFIVKIEQNGCIVPEVIGM